MSPTDVLEVFTQAVTAGVLVGAAIVLLAVVTR